MNRTRLMGIFLMIAALVFAGCGGGGGTSLMVDGQRATQALIDELQDDHDAEEKRANDAERERDAANTTLMALMADLNAASTSTEDLMAAVTGLEGMRDDYQGKVTAAMTAINTALGDDATGNLADDIGTLSEDATTYGGALEAVRMALDAASISEADLIDAVEVLEGMRNEYKNMVAAVRTGLGLGMDATQAEILAEIMKLAASADPFVVAQATTTAAAQVTAAATKAVKDATKYSTMIDVMSVRGDSGQAMANAQTVLDAEGMVSDNLAKAQSALSRAKTAKDNVDENADNSDVLMEALDEAIEVAEEAVKTAQGQKDSFALANALKAVRGTDKDDPMTAADHAKAVAMAVGGALGATSNTNGAGTRVLFLGTTSERPAGEAKYEQNDRQGMTWEMIVGSTNVMDFRIVSGAGTAGVRGSSVAGMTAADVDADLTATGGVDSGNEYADGFQTAGSTYKGIPGTTFCNGSDCSVDASGNLKGGWYFTPTSPKEWYTGTTDSTTGVTMYSAETQYAKYGYWVSGTNDAATVNVYAMTGAATGTSTDFNVSTVNDAASATTLLDAKATYSGDAIGISLYKEVNTDGTIASGFPVTGEFTADVNLTATFGAAASLSGTITNFEGDAVHSDWKVTLQNASFDDGTFGVTDNAVAAGSGTQGGIWTATAYGSATTERPEGIFGHFNTHFTNGHAAGAYATMKD